MRCLGRQAASSPSPARCGGGSHRGAFQDLAGAPRVALYSFHSLFTFVSSFQPPIPEEGVGLTTLRPPPCPDGVLVRPTVRPAHVGGDDSGLTRGSTRGPAPPLPWVPFPLGHGVLSLTQAAPRLLRCHLAEPVTVASVHSVVRCRPCGVWGARCSPRGSGLGTHLFAVGPPGVVKGRGGQDSSDDPVCSSGSETFSAKEKFIASSWSFGFLLKSFLFLVSLRMF